MSDQNRQTAHNSVKVVIEELTALLRDQSAKLLSGSTKLALTTTTLNCLNRCFQHINHDETLETISRVPTTGATLAGITGNSFEENVQYLYDFIKQILTLKVIQGAGTLRGSVDVGHFSGLKILELKRIPIHLFVGLQFLRTRLQLISCERCLQSLEELFSLCGGDRSSPFSWPDLLSANLSFNTIEKLDSSLRLLPALVSLDISHNSLKDLVGLEYLNELEYLNLSYNQLRCLPMLSSRASVRLKVLSFRNNCLEVLDGLHRFINLQQVDFAFNCLLDHCNLSPFLRLPCVKLICLEGNPIFYHDKHRPLTIDHLHQRSLTLEFILDGQALKKSEIAEAKKFLSNCQTWKHSARDWNESASINSISTEQVVVHSESTMTLRGTDCRSYENPSGCDLDSSIEIDNSDSSKPVHSKPKKKSRKTPTVREALIDDGCLDGGFVSQDDICVISPAQLPTQNTLLHELSNEHQQAKEELEKFRQRHGSEWLIIGSKLNVLPAPEEPVQCRNGTFQQIADQSPKEDYSEIAHNERTNRASQVSDDVVVLNEDSESPPLIAVTTNLSHADREDQCDMQDSHTSDKFPWEQTMQVSDEETASDDVYLTPFIIQMEKPGSDKSETILVIVGDCALKEKNIVTGRTVEKLEFRSIRTFETLPPKKVSLDGIECQNPRIRMTFNYVRKDRRERIYTMDDQESYQQFCELLQSVVDANTFEEMTVGALHCLKCSSQFSRDGAKKVLRKSHKPPEDVIVLPSSVDNSKDYLCEANACPNCSSEMIMELEQSHALHAPLQLFSTSSPYMKYLDPGNASKTSVGIPINQSTPVSSGKTSHDQNLGSSCPTIHTSEKPMIHSKTEPSLLNLNMLPSASDIFKGGSYSRAGCCNVVQVEVEVHGPRRSNAEDAGLRLCSSLTLTQTHTMGESAGIRRSESDITILSNPSQSSILVMPNPSIAELSLAAISESSSDCNRLVGTLSSQPVEIQASGKYLDDKLCLGSTRVQRLGSCSSDSLTGSANTTVEKSVYDIPPGIADSSIPVLNEKDDNKQLLESNRLADETYSRSCNADKNSTSSDESTEVIRDDHSYSCGSNNSHSAPDLNVTHCALVQSHANDNASVLNAAKVLMWSCKDTAILYSFQDFSQLDHRLKLFLDMEVFNVDEELIAVLRAGVVPYAKGEEWPGLLVITRSNVYILKITGPEIDQPQDWLQKFDSRPVNLLYFVNIRLGSQAFQLEFGPKSAPVCYSFILRDADHCNNFVSFLMEKTKSGLLNIPESQLYVGLDGNETLQTIREQLLNIQQSDSSDEFLEKTDSEASEEHIWLYLLGYWKPSGKSEFEHISIVTTSTDVFLFTEDFHWPLPHLVLPSNEVLCQPQLISRMHQQIQDLTAMEQLENHPLEVHLKFFDENSQQEHTWTLAMETERSRQTFLQALKEPWEKLFGVELQVALLPEQE